MKIILLENVKNLGSIGDIKEVSDGYARNFLIPKKLAEIATAEAIKKVELLKKDSDQKKEAQLKENQGLVKILNGKEIIIKGKEKKGKLFGSVGTKEIAKELKNQGIKINEEHIVLDAPIKEVGKKEVKIKLGNGMEAKIKVIIKGE